MDLFPEGFSGMLYIHETPIQFGLIIATWIVLLYGIFVAYRWIITQEEQKEWNWMMFLILFFLLFTYTCFAAMIYLLPATATATQLLPYYLAAWSSVALYGFFLVNLVFTLPWFKEKHWMRYLFLIATVSFLVVLWFFTTPAASAVVSDGVMNWLAMPLVVVAYGGILAIIYFFIVPFYHVYRVTKPQTGALRTANWIAWFGMFLWHIAAMCMALVAFLALLMPIILAIALIGLIISYIGLTLANRAIARLRVKQD